MGISVGSRAKAVRSDINITPLVDVVLVLLIIFMVLVPITMRQVALDVPPELDVTTQTTTQRPVTLLLKNDLSVVLDNGDREQTIRGADLAKTLQPMLDAKKTEKVVFVDFEDGVAWRDVISVIDTVRGASSARLPNGAVDWDGVQVALRVRQPS